MEAAPLVGVDATWWDESTGLPPTEPAFTGVAVRVKLRDGPVWVHPEHGVVQNPGGWGRNWLVSADGDRLQSEYIYARGEDKPSELDIIGKIVVDKEGKASGELRIRATGAFFDPDKLREADAQKKKVKEIVGRFLSDVDVPGHSIATLSDTLLQATASVASKDELEKLDGRRLLKLGDGPAFLKEIPLPLNRSYRRTDVHTNGRFHERVNLTFEVPKKWQSLAVPRAMSPVEGPWGRVEQRVEVRDETIRFYREVSVLTDLIAPDHFESLRAAVNELMANQSLLLVVGKSMDAD
jgi:hypothetical protein